MPTRLLLEGNDLQALLSQVRAEHGPAAKIVAADRVRNTGLMGVFAKQRYELTVEIPDSTGPAALPAGPSSSEKAAARPATHFKAGLPSATIAYQAGLATAATTGIPGAAPEPDGRPHATVTMTGSTAEPPAADSTSPAVLPGRAGDSPADALLAVVEEQERAPHQAPPAAGTRPMSPAPANGSAQMVTSEAAAFADVLAGFGVPGWSTSNDVPDTPQALLAAINAAPSPAPGPPTEAPTGAAGAATVDRTDGAADVGSADGAADVTGRTGADTAAGVNGAASATCGERVAVVAVPEEAVATVARAAGDGSSVPAEMAAPTVQAAPVVPAYRPVRLAGDAPLRAMLAYLGVPPELAERVTGFDSYRAIVKIMKLLPPTPAAPSGPGDVLAIVGEVSAALATAATVSRRLDLGPANTLLAATTVAGTGVHSSRRLTGPDHAARRVAKLREKSDRPLVVVVEAPADGSGTRTARAILAELEPDMTLGVVDATRKTADAARLLADIGGVDAIAVRSCAATADPASVLQLGLPVALVDDREPTAHMWADLLCRRLEEVVAE